MEFSILLGQWYEENKRDLPWRGESNRIVTKITLKEPD